MNRILAIVCLAALSACRGEPVEEADSLVSVVPDAPVPTGASVAEIRRARAERAKPPKPPGYVILGTQKDQLEIGHATLVDLGTGCQYTVRTIFQDGIDIAPRMERGPGANDDSEQRCRTTSPRRSGFVLLPGSTIDTVHVSIVLDQETGCQSIVGTIFQDDVASTPRMRTVGGSRRQMCGAPKGDAA
jgi:hypothetical protein